MGPTSPLPPTPGPRVIRTMAAGLDRDPAIRALVAELRAASGGCLFVSGGAARMEAGHRRLVHAALAGIVDVRPNGRPLVVGDGGTQSGVMELLGLIRADAPHPFPLVGIVPAPEVPPRGHTPLDPHHSHIVAVDDPAWSGDGHAWGAETPAMFTLFSTLAEGRPSVALVANGGAIALDEVARHLDADRRVIVLAGTGRTADALASGLGRTSAADALSPDPALASTVVHRGLLARPDTFTVVHVNEGPRALATAIADGLAKSA